MGGISTTFYPFLVYKRIPYYEIMQSAEAIDICHDHGFHSLRDLIGYHDLI